MSKTMIGLCALALSMTTTALAQNGDLVIVVENADGDATITAIPHQPPPPAAVPRGAQQTTPAESGSALDAPVVLVLPPGSQVRVLDVELREPEVAEPPVTYAPPPTYTPPPMPLPTMPRMELDLERQLHEAMRRRPSLAFPIALMAGGAVSGMFSGLGLLGANVDCGFGDCNRQRRNMMRGLVVASVATFTFGVFRLIRNARARHRVGREIREIRRQIAYRAQGMAY